MTSIPKTLDYLVSNSNSNSAQSKQRSPSTDPNVTLSISSNKKKLPRPPPIPSSPKTKPDASATVDITLRKFELDAANECWEENTMKRKENMNGAHSYGLLTKFGLNSPHYQYQSLISHLHTTHKKHIQELLDDGRSLRIVQHTESGCPTVKHPMAKKGCWCIEERRKRKKAAQSNSRSAAVSAANTSLRSGSGSSTQNGSLPPNHSLNGLQSLNHLRSAHSTTNGINGIGGTAPLIPNQSLIQQQLANQKAINIMNYYSNPLYRLNAATNPMLTMPTVSKTASDIAQSLILNARTQTMYHSSNRMQQLRMQQLLNDRTLKANGTATTTATATAPSTTMTIPGITDTATEGGGGSVLGVRQHKDTVVFSNGASTGPPTKRRKKSRWSDK